MERLTFEGNFCDIAMCRENPCPYNGSCTQREVWERLKVYEDTGLTPEVCANYKAFEDEAISKGVPFKRIVALMEADRAGRLVALPCKVGDTVWAILDGAKDARECKVDFVNIGSVGTTIVFAAKDWLREQYGVAAAAFGKTVFLTREEAEEVLRRAENG